VPGVYTYNTLPHVPSYGRAVFVSCNEGRAPATGISSFIETFSLPVRPVNKALRGLSANDGLLRGASAGDREALRKLRKSLPSHPTLRFPSPLSAHFLRGDFSRGSALLPPLLGWGREAPNLSRIHPVSEARSEYISSILCPYVTPHSERGLPLDSACVHLWAISHSARVSPGGGAAVVARGPAHTSALWPSSLETVSTGRAFICSPSFPAPPQSLRASRACVCWRGMPRRRKSGPNWQFNGGLHGAMRRKQLYEFVAENALCRRKRIVQYPLPLFPGTLSSAFAFAFAFAFALFLLWPSFSILISISRQRWEGKGDETTRQKSVFAGRKTHFPGAGKRYFYGPGARVRRRRHRPRRGRGGRKMSFLRSEKGVGEGEEGGVALAAFFDGFPSVDAPVQIAESVHFSTSVGAFDDKRFLAEPDVHSSADS